MGSEGDRLWGNGCFVCENSWSSTALSVASRPTPACLTGRLTRLNHLQSLPSGIAQERMRALVLNPLVVLMCMDQDLVLLSDTGVPSLPVGSQILAVANFAVRTVSDLPAQPVASCRVWTKAGLPWSPPFCPAPCALYSDQPVASM